MHNASPIWLTLQHFPNKLFIHAYPYYKHALLFFFAITVSEIQHEWIPLPLRLQNSFQLWYTFQVRASRSRALEVGVEWNGTQRKTSSTQCERVSSQWRGLFSSLGLSMGSDAEHQHDAALQRHVMALIVAHLRDNNLNQAAIAVSNATMTPMQSEVPANRLLDLVRKGLAVDRDDAVPVSTIDKSGSGATLAGYGPLPTVARTSLDFSSVQATKGSSKTFAKYDSRHVSEHKNMARCARFSPDGRLVATGSADTSIKLFEVDKVRQMMIADGGASRESPIRPVIRTFYDHMQPINDLDFHPQMSILISGAKDRTIKFFDFAKSAARRAVRVIQDTHNVRSVAFHPCGDYLLAGTDHPIAHLYDVSTFQCYLSTTLQDNHVGGAINQVRYSATGGLYVTASKDGGVRIWDGLTARCVRAITGAHGTTEATSAAFTKDQRYVLSCGKDSQIRLWEVGTGRQVKSYQGAQHPQMRCQATFNHTEEFILSVDESQNEIVVWDSLTGDVVSRIPSTHVGAPRWIEHSPSEAAFVSCGTDRSIRFWRELF